MRVGISLPVREMADDLIAIRDFAQAAEALGLTHLRVPDQIYRKGSGHLHEPMMLLSYIAAITNRIELVPSVIILPSRQTVLFAKQAAELDRLSQGRVRIGVGVGGSQEEYVALGEDFQTRGRRCSEQLAVLSLLWRGESTAELNEFHNVDGASLNPLPVQQPIPVWIGAASVPSKPVIRRIGQLASGWFVLCSPEQFDGVSSDIRAAAENVDRNPQEIGTEAGVAVVGPREAEWRQRVEGWYDKGLTHLCLRTLGGGIDVADHIPKMQEAVKTLPIEQSTDP